MLIKFLKLSFFLYRSSHRKCSVIKGVLRNFAKFTGKHLCQSLFFNKVAGLRPPASNFIKKWTPAQLLSCEFCKISKNSFFIEHLDDDPVIYYGSLNHPDTTSSRLLFPICPWTLVPRPLLAIPLF